MRDIYLIDFENVASEGLSGITYLAEDDQVIIFYSTNSNRLTMKMHILIGKSICNLSYFEVTVGGKNALDHQISTYLGYLMGTNAAERNYYIVSRDMGYKHVANFWASQKIGPRVRCIDSIKGASRLERNRREAVLQPVPQESEATTPEPTPETTPERVEVPAAEASLLPTAEPEAVESPAANALTEPQPVAPAATVEVAPEAPSLEPLPEPEQPPELPAGEVEIPQPQETAVQEPKAADEPELSLSADPKPEPQRRLNRNRPRPRGRYRKNTAASEPKSTAQEPAPVESQPESQEKKPEPKESLPETQEKKGESPEKKPEPKKKSGVKKAGIPKQDSSCPDQLSSLIAPYPKLQENVLRDLIANNKRQVLCNTLRKHLGQEKGLALYNEIKKSAWH